MGCNPLKTFTNALIKTSSAITAHLDVLTVKQLMNFSQPPQQYTHTILGMHIIKNKLLGIDIYEYIHTYCTVHQVQLLLTLSFETTFFYVPQPLCWTMNVLYPHICQRA